MRWPLLAAGVLALAQAGAAPVRPLYAGAAIHDTIAGGEKAVFTFDIPADSAARMVVNQEGVDVNLTLRRAGSNLPEHGLDLVSGHEGAERGFPPISDAPTSWTATIATAYPSAPRGSYTISLDVAPADDHARALADAFQQHHAASDIAWIGDGESHHRAMAGYAAAADAAMAAGDLELAAEATYQCARQHDVLGDITGAIESQKRALDLFRSTGRRDREARVLDRLGDLSRKIGEVEQAEHYFAQALPMARAVDDPATVVDILNNSGIVLFATGRYEDAIDQLGSAIPVAHAIDSRDTEITLWANMGQAYQDLGQLDKAVESLQHASALAGHAGNPRRLAKTLQMTASALYENGDRATAEKTIQASLDAFIKAQDHTLEATAVATYGEMLLGDGDASGAVTWFARAYPVLHQAQTRGEEARLLTSWAEALVSLGDPAAALEKVDAALPLDRLVLDHAGEAQAQYVRALALRQAGRTAEAVDAAAAATTLAESTRGSLVRTELRATYLSMVHSYFDVNVDLLQQRGLTAAAFETSERGRARSLLDGLAESAAKIEKGVDPALLARQRDVQKSLAAKESYRAQVVVADGERDARVNRADHEIARLIDEWNSVQAEIRASSPAYSALKTPSPVTLADLQKTLLDPATALVEYHLGSAHSYAWVIDRSSIAVHELPPARHIEALARRYHELVSRDVDALAAPGRERLRREVASEGRRLAAVVWAPIESGVRGKRLLIVADGALQYVPFAALPTSNGTRVLERHELVYLPSASVLETIRRTSRPIPENATAAVFADPVFSTSDPRLAAARDTAALSKTRAADGGSYSRLRFSRREAEAIRAVRPDAFEALDFAASKATVTSQDLSKYSILHFATHGSLNTAHPELSGLVLSLVDRKGKPVDGFLRLHDIYNLNLDADLVVLSACRTALGKDVHGEGLIGLTRGFMYAGASRVVSSVWNVDDRASALLMSRFYAEMLARHLAPAAALRQAQLSLLAEARWADPHYWAAFSLQGEWK